MNEHDMLAIYSGLRMFEVRLPRGAIKSCGAPTAALRIARNTRRTDGKERGPSAEMVAIPKYM